MESTPGISSRTPTILSHRTLGNSIFRFIPILFEKCSILGIPFTRSFYLRNLIATTEEAIIKYIV